MVFVWKCSSKPTFKPEKRKDCLTMSGRERSTRKRKPSRKGAALADKKQKVPQTKEEWKKMLVSTFFYLTIDNQKALARACLLQYHDDDEFVLSFKEKGIDLKNPEDPTGRGGARGGQESRSWRNVAGDLP